MNIIRTQRDLAAKDEPLSNRKDQPKKYSRWIGKVLFFISTILLSAACVGYAWRDDRFALIGILGLGIFFLGQLQCQKLISVFVHSLLTGYLTFFLANSWMHWTVAGLMDGSDVTILLIVQAVHLLHGGLWCLFAVSWWFARRYLAFGWMLAPAIWLVIESFYPAMFPMRQGCFLLAATPLIQITSLFGVAAATLQAILLASLLPLGWIACGPIAKKRNGLSRAGSSEINPAVLRRCMAPTPATAGRTLVLIGLLTTLNFVWGSYRIHQSNVAEQAFSGDFLKVGVVQGDTEYGGFHSNMEQRTRGMTPNCDLIVWPECSLGHYSQDLTSFTDENEIYLKSLGVGTRFRPLADPDCYLLGGGYSWIRKPKQKLVDARYVSAYLLDLDENLLGRHDKIELMAGGEYLPFESTFPQLGQLLETDDPGAYVGPESVPLSRGLTPYPIGVVKDVKIAAMLCCEDMYPWLSREFTNQGADLLVCMANGMSFDSEIALRQHFNIARFRAVENNRYFLRCGSYGVSALISPAGKILGSAPCFEEVDLQFEIPIQHRPRTVFNKIGDVLTFASWGWLGLSCLWLIRPLRKRADQ